MHNPWLRKKPNPKRKEPRRVRGRERLTGDEKESRRRELFERSGGHCEAERAKDLYGCPIDGEPIYSRTIITRCSAPITWETMHWSHNRHAANKDDSLSAGLATCEDCHRNYHNAGGKPAPRKPGRVMNKSEAQAYLLGTKCFCDQPKLTRHVFCDACNDKLTEQTRLNLRTLTHREWLEAVADAEKEILTHS